MNCPQLLKISMLLDEELSPDEQVRLRTHLKQCPECSQAWEDFKALSAGLEAATADASANALEVLDRILDPPQAGFWQRRIAVPAPLAAAAAFLLVALSIWAGTMQFEKQPLAPPPARFEASTPAPSSGIDLARFDQGEGPLIYTQPKPEGHLR